MCASVSVCLCVCVSVCLCVYVSVCLWLAVSVPPLAKSEKPGSWCIEDWKMGGLGIGEMGDFGIGE